MHPSITFSKLCKYLLLSFVLVIVTLKVHNLLFYDPSASSESEWLAAISDTIELCEPHEAKLRITPPSSASCLDGSPPAYYLRRGSVNNKWHVHFEGGGWCFDLEQCFLRSKTDKGSSKHYPSCDRLEHYLSSVDQKNPMMYSWNTVLVKYCDGGSYAGDTTVEYKVG